MPEEAVQELESAPSASEPTSSSESISDLDSGSRSAPEGSRADSESNGEAQQKPSDNKPKELSRYEKTKRHRAYLRQEQGRLEQEKARLAQERRELEEARKPKRDYTLAELQKYRGQWEREGQFDLVEAADREIRVMQAEEAQKRAASVNQVNYPVLGTPEHKAQWEQAEREIAQSDPEFMRSGTRLDTKLREIMGSRDGDIYRSHPRGIVAAYDRAVKELLKADNDSLRTELEKIKTELQRYRGLTSIGSGAPGRVGAGNGQADFSKLSTKDMRKRLLQGAKPDGVPWF